MEKLSRSTLGAKSGALTPENAFPLSPPRQITGHSSRLSPNLSCEDRRAIMTQNPRTEPSPSTQQSAPSQPPAAQRTSARPLAPRPSPQLLFPRQDGDVLPQVSLNPLRRYSKGRLQPVTDFSPLPPPAAAATAAATATAAAAADAAAAVTFVPPLTNDLQGPDRAPQGSHVGSPNAADPSLDNVANYQANANEANVAVTPTANGGAGEVRKRKRPKGSRAGAPNYIDQDINALLTFASQVTPIGVKNWRVVADKFNEHSRSTGRPERDFESLRNKFDKLAHTKVSIDDSQCPPHIRWAKQIASAIYAKCNAYEDGDASSDEENNPNGVEATPGASEDNQQARASTTEKPNGGVESDEADSGHDSAPARKRRTPTEFVDGRKRKKRARGAGFNQSTEEVVHHLADISKCVREVANVVVKKASGGSFVQFVPPSVDEGQIERIVKEQVRAELATTNAAISDLKKLVLEFMRSSGGQDT